ncbi:3-hexulose-6-phosphate synthase [Bhargavaea cecembensis DSE10]|uniref:3-hexulose-6-phosphate synthase n=1 Tax=Bhargavaea cecembensis DSE10 TaxID=1235279 RepID=M7NY78_9BACL|nr:3-hexulose-6-phosphate synthase [Bhargavaea cecembensis]EMR06640.1 3-hexulose-6-phosphate synthase [Bhargavaea cecembensis DSE10]
MKLQLALDRLSREECIDFIAKTRDFIDWIEVGTGTIKEHGIRLVRDIKDAYPDKTVVADMKICDSGRHEAEMAFRAGADVVTVMGFAGIETIRQVLESAKENRKRVMVDLLEVTDSGRVRNIYLAGADLFCLHIGKDRQSSGKQHFEDQLHLVGGLDQADLAVAGGIGPDNLPSLRKLGVGIAIVGSYITNSQDPEQAAAGMADALRRSDGQQKHL